ncbi:MAG: SAM-dependent methyltransferase [Candidatus Baltobacteraceae bacterium]
MRRPGGSLSAVGIGIRAPAQTSLEASARIERADKVFSLVADPLAEYWIRSVNANTESLGPLYAVGKDRRETYREMVERIVGAVLDGGRVCAVSYGHPGVSAYPLHESVRRVRASGLPAEMLAAISAEDCLFADLGIDPVVGGCCSYEATDFLVHRRSADPSGNLILWQIGVIAEAGFKREESAWNRDGLSVLAERLLEIYPPEHEVVVYEAPKLPVCDARIERVALAALPRAGVTPMSTLFVPPMMRARVDEAMVKRLCLTSRAPSS